MIPPRAPARFFLAAAIVGAVVAGATSAQPPRPASRRAQRPAGQGDRARPEMLAANAGNGVAAPTFAQDVVPIFIKNCTVCHHIGGPGPFPLYSYDSALAYTKELKENISELHMPPFHATGPKGVFRNDRRLSEADRNTILRWLDQGAKQGDVSKMPAEPVYPREMWSIGKPDVVLSMPMEFEVPARGKIDYQHFQVPTNFTEDKWIVAYEIMPSAREVVHHVQVFAKAPPEPPRPAGTPGERSPLVRNRTYEPLQQRTFFSRLFEDAPVDRGVLISSMAPGTNAVEFPPGTAMLVKKGTVLTFTMHYTAHGHAMKDRTRIGFRFLGHVPDEQIYASQFTNTIFELPPGAKGVQVPSEIGAREPIRIWGLLPHTHLRGTRWLYRMQKPDGTTQTVLDIPKYDFNWQIYYLWVRPLELPAGGKITAMAWYDNSEDNKDNPDPTKTVRHGEQTWEEMQYTGFLYSIPSRRVRRTAAR